MASGCSLATMAFFFPERVDETTHFVGLVAGTGCGHTHCHEPDYALGMANTDNDHA